LPGTFTAQKNYNRDILPVKKNYSAIYYSFEKLMYQCAQT